MGKLRSQYLDPPRDAIPVKICRHFNFARLIYAAGGGYFTILSAPINFHPIPQVRLNYTLSDINNQMIREFYQELICIV
jgi:membrane protease subunit (stomatin/prohibitin family)